MSQLLVRDGEPFGKFGAGLVGLFALLGDIVRPRPALFDAAISTTLDAMFELRRVAKCLRVVRAASFQIATALRERRLGQIQLGLLLPHPPIEFRELCFGGRELFGRFGHHLLGVACP